MYGIKLDNASNCVITNNTIRDIWSIMAMNAIDFDGIHVKGGNSNVFTKNTLVNNLLGMNFIETANNVIVENTIDYTSQGVNSVPSGINFYRSSGNVIYHNTFKAEGTQAGSYESNNTWDNGFPNGGNYWSNYGAGGSNFTKINGTGIYDSPYLINEVNIDYYPLVEPYTAITPTITIISGERV
jgi:parallel beta-helix repeat protein